MLALSPEEWTAVRLSLWVASVATLVAVPFGIGIAWLLARKRFYGKAILDALPAMLNGETEIQAGLDQLNETLKPILAAEAAN